MKLKTLKDILSIKSEKDAHGHILTQQFQQVAKEWIKALKMSCGDDGDGHIKVVANIDWITKFFNLDETKKPKTEKLEKYPQGERFIR